MATEQELFRAVFQTEGIDAAISNTEAFARACQDLYQKLRGLSQSPEIEIKQDRALAAITTLQLAVSKYADAQDDAAKEPAAFAALARSAATAKTAVNALLTETEKLNRAQVLGDRARSQGTGVVPSSGSTTGNVRADKFLQQAEDAERAFVNFQAKRNAAIERGLKSEDELTALNERATKIAARRDELLDKALAELSGAAEAERTRQANIIPDDRIKQLLTPTFDPTDISALGRARKRQAQLALDQIQVDEQILAARNDARTGAVSEAQSEGALKQLAEKRAVLEQEILRNQDLIRTAVKDEAAAREAAASAATRQNQGFFATQKSNFAIGFKGEADKGYAEQIGQAFKFSVFYGTAYKLLFAFTQTLQATLQEGIEFQQGMTDLAIATGQTKDQVREVGERLGQIAAETGASPAQGPQIAARAIGLFGASSADPGEQARIAEITTRVVSRLAVGSKQQPIDLLGNLGAITQALGQGAGGVIRAADLDAFLTKRFGVQQGSTFDAVAQSASAGKAAGFSDEELFAIAANVISRTGQSSSAVGGYLAQLFTRGGEGALLSTAQRFGVDTNQKLADVLKDLAAAYKTASPNEQNVIAASTGRGKSQSALIGGFFSSIGDIEAAANDAKRLASGSADQQFEARMKDLGGQIAALQGSFKEFAHLLGETGLLDVLGLGIVALKDLVDVVNGVLQVFDDLPHGVRDAIIALGLFTLSLRTSAGRNAVTGIAAQGSYLRDAFRTGGAGAVGGEVASSARTAAIAAAPVAAVAALAGVVVSVASLINSTKKFNNSTDLANAQETSIDAPRVGSSATRYRSQADALDQIANQSRGSTGAIAQIVTFGHANDAAIKQAQSLEAEANRLRGVADRIDANTKVDPARTFAGFDSESLKAGLDQISNGGGSAATQLKALGEAINGLDNVAAKARGKIDVEALGSQLLSDGTKGFSGSTFQELGADPGRGAGPRNAPSAEIEKRVRAYLRDNLQKGLEAKLKALGIDNISSLTPDQVSDIAQSLSTITGKDQKKYGLKGIDETGLSTIKALLTDNIETSLYAAIQGVQDQISGLTKDISGADAEALASSIISVTQANASNLSKNDFQGQSRNAQGLVDYLKTIKAHTTDDAEIDQLNLQIGQAKAGVVQIQIDRLEALRKKFNATTGSQKAATAHGREIVAQEIAAIVKGGGTADQLVGVLESAGKGAIAIANKQINDAIKVALAANKIHQAIVQAAAILAGTIAGPFGAVLQFAGAVQAFTDPTVANLVTLANSTQYAAPNANPDQIPKDKTAEAGDTAAQIRAAKLAAAAARKGGSIASAQAEVASAQAELDKAKKGSVAYYNALASFYKAQDSLKQAFRDYNHILRELRIDTTDPVAQAREALTTARQKLAADLKAGKARDVTAQDKLDVKNAAQDYQKALFDQNLSDIQTAEQLGQVSHGAYIRYLQSEHNRLSSIAHKTRDQVDELNQIDQLIKDANSELQGQFNIGDIKLPTPYEVRRYLQSNVGVANGASGASVVNSTTTIYIDGADTAQVKRIISDTVGKGARVLTTSSRRN